MERAAICLKFLSLLFEKFNCLQHIARRQRDDTSVIEENLVITCVVAKNINLAAKAQAFMFDANVVSTHGGLP